MDWKELSLAKKILWSNVECGNGGNPNCMAAMRRPALVTHITDDNCSVEPERCVELWLNEH